MTKLQERLARLVSRLEKEVQRGERGTVAVGGVTKAGNELESVVKAAAELVCAARGESLADEMRRRGERAGIGVYLRVTGGARSFRAGDPDDARIVRALSADANQRHASKLNAMRELRNVNDHPGGDPLSRAEKIMRALLLWLKREVVPPAA